MRIGILGAANSIHIVRIANKLSDLGHEVTVCSLPDQRDDAGQINCEVIYLKHGGGKGYYLNGPEVRKIAAEKSFDVLNAHYASGYGTLGRVSRVKPLVTSVWGSDIFLFPKRNKINELIIKKNLLAADRLFSTSHCMKEEVKKYIGEKRVTDVTPFGIDVDVFTPKECLCESNVFTLGFFKGTNEIYGIDVFLEVVRELKCRFGESGKQLQVRICGGGNRTDYIKEKIREFDIEDIIDYVGLIPYEKMPETIRSCDAACIPSISESFGVIAIEAMACGVPCITSDAPGLREVVVDGYTGYIVKADDVSGYVEKIMLLASDRELTGKLGINGRKHVKENYDFDDNIKLFIEGFDNER